MSDLAGAMYEVPPTLLDMWLKGLINDDEDRRLLIQWAERARGHGQPVALVGAGMSLNAVSRPGHRGSDGRPARAWTWRQMEEAFKAALPRAEQDGADPLWLAELYERSFGRAALINLVHRAVPADALEPGPAHRELLGIPWHTLLTTNYDDLLERAWQNPTLPLRRVWKEEQLASPRPGGSSVIHLHGVLDDPTSIVLTLESYRRYPQTHPGLVTKVRQLFMEHPLLMIGFSAVDPNFVQWMGWVEDVLGDLHPLHLNLFVTPDGATPSAPRRTYWHDRVRFVPCRVADLEKVLEAIGKFLRGIPRSADTSLPDDLVTYLRGSTSPADAMARLNTLWGMDPARKDDNDQRQEGLDIVATHLAELRAVDPDDAGSPVPGSPATPPARAGVSPDYAATLARAMASEEDARCATRSAFGDAWPEVLGLVTVNIWRLDFRLRNTSFDFEGEVNALDARHEARPALQRHIGWCRLLADIHRARTWPEEAIEAWRHQVGTPTAEELSELDDLRSLHDLRGDRPLTAPDNPNLARDLRRMGFLASLRDEREAAWRAYQGAAERSEADGEPPDLVWATVESARLAAQRYATHDPAAPAEIARSEREWAWRSHRLRARWGPEITRREAAWQRAAELHIDNMWESAATPPSRKPDSIFGGDRGDGAERQLDWAEKNWLEPSVVQRLAEINAGALWRHARYQDSRGAQSLSPWFEAALTWRRYGSQHLQHAATWLVEFGDPDTEEPLSFLDALRAEGRWPAEWDSAARALAVLMPALPVERLDEVGRWTDTLERELTDAAPRRSRYHLAPPEWVAVKLRLAVMAVSPPAEVITTLRALTRRHPWWLDESHDLKLRLPWPDWARHGLLPPDEVIAALTELVAEETRRNPSRWLQNDHLWTLVRVPGWHASPAARAAVEARLARHPTSAESHAIVAAHDTPERAAAFAAEVAGRIRGDGEQASNDDIVALTHLADHLTPEDRTIAIDAALALLASMHAAAEHAAEADGSRFRAPQDPTKPRRRYLISAIARCCVASNRDAVAPAVLPAVAAWRGALRADPDSAPLLAQHRSVPSSWFDPATEAIIDDLLRGLRPRARATADRDRRYALNMLASWAWHGAELAWRRLPALTALLRHPDARLTADAARVVGRLAANPDAPIASAPWDRWVAWMDLAMDDRRVLVRMAVAWTVTRARADLPDDVRAAVDVWRRRLTEDRRAGVHASLQGW